MSLSEERVKNNKIRRIRERRKNFILSIMTLCLVITLSFTVNSFLSHAKSNAEQVSIKYYKSILLQPGDTLWSIAGEYMGTSYSDKESYVTEVRKMNSLRDDEITAGNYLVIPYYSNTFKVS